MLNFVFDSWSRFLSFYSSEWYIILAFPILISIVYIIKEVISRV